MLFGSVDDLHESVGQTICRAGGRFPFTTKWRGFLSNNGPSVIGNQRSVALLKLRQKECGRPWMVQPPTSETNWKRGLIWQKNVCRNLGRLKIDWLYIALFLFQSILLNKCLPGASGLLAPLSFPHRKLVFFLYFSRVKNTRPSRLKMPENANVIVTHTRSCNYRLRHATMFDASYN